MPTLLHISDLHRTLGPRLDNDELVAAITSDAKRWKNEGIPEPDLIIVSGDLIQGASIATLDPDTEIESQYNEASKLLRHLADEFVDSNRSRVIIVPGNHDVHWGRARNSMESLEICPADISSKAFEAKSQIRWNWKNQKAYRISNSDLYDSRFEHFQTFRKDFYAETDPNPLLCEDGGLVFSEYPSLGIVVVGFSSWHGNDCFCHVGDISSASLALSRKLLASSNAPVAVAVWHHSIVGGPREQDYMDRRIIHKLIDFGFSVGLHGHQHYPDAAPFELHLPNLTSMTVIGAGSLAVGDSELPMGERRQFNIVVIDPKDKSITVHVRAMSADGIFTGSHRDDFGGNTFIKLDLPFSSSRPKGATSVRQLDDAMTAVATKRYEKALQLLIEIDSSHSYKKRQIKIEALEGLQRHEELIDVLNPPQTVDEVVRIISLLLDAEKFDQAEACLDSSSKWIDRSLLKDLTKTIAARKMMS